MMSYHTFTEDGHYCPTCKAGPFPCYMEDGQCDNAGTCGQCLQDQRENQGAGYVEELDNDSI
jgi:hypothetical protein